MKDRVFSHYRVLDVIGRGGMGVVYEAEDLKLGRRVALKFLPEGLDADERSRARLQQEARAASSLNHPHICTIYEVDEDHEHPFIAMELLHGRTLDQMISGRPLAIDRLLTLAGEVCSALDAAHRSGLVHRDLKPGNIFVTSQGFAKVMDFGLAKRTAPTLSGPDEHTVGLSALTADGTVVGTMFYMAPEQLRGEELDGRSDLYSFGLVLYEMATGRPAFDRSTPALAIDSALNRTPAWPSTLNPLVPARLDDIIGKALEKDPALRYQSAAELAADLKRVMRDTLALSSPVTGVPTARATELPGPVPSARAPRLRWVGAVGAVVGVIVLGAGAWRWRTAPPSAQLPSLTGATFAQLTDQPGAEVFPTLSPDGTLLAYVIRSEDGDGVYVQRVGGQKPTRLADGTFPVFSPNGEQIAFRSDRSGGGIFIMGSSGEAVRRRTTFGYTTTWSPDGSELVFDTEGVIDPVVRFSNSRLWRVGATEGEPFPLTPEDVDAVQPSWSPHNKRIAYYGKAAAGTSKIWTIPVSGGPPTVAVDAPALNWSPVWSPDGRYLYFLSNAAGNTSLWWLPIDETSGRPQGAPRILSASPNPMAYLTISRDGRRLAYAQQLRMGTLESIALDPVSHMPTGKPSLVTRTTKGSVGLDVSSDNRLFAFASAADRNLYVMGSDGSDLRQLADSEIKIRLPRFSPDGKQIAFAGGRAGQSELWVIDVDGSGLRQVATGPHGPIFGSVWSPDGTRIAYADVTSGVLIADPRTAAPQGARKPIVGHRAGGFVFPASWSPDGRKLALTTFGKDNAVRAVIVYDLESGQATDVSESAGGGLWLSDSRHLITFEQWSGKVYLLDTVSRQQKLLFSTSLSRIDGIALSADNRSIYMNLTALESDVWLLTIP